MAVFNARILRLMPAEVLAEVFCCDLSAMAKESNSAGVISVRNSTGLKDVNFLRADSKVVAVLGLRLAERKARYRAKKPSQETLPESRTFLLSKISAAFSVAADLLHVPKERRTRLPDGSV